MRHRAQLAPGQIWVWGNISVQFRELSSLHTVAGLVNNMLMKKKPKISVHMGRKTITVFLRRRESLLVLCILRVSTRVFFEDHMLLIHVCDRTHI